MKLLVLLLLIGVLVSLWGFYSSSLLLVGAKLPLLLTPAHLGLAFEEISLTASDGLVLKGWFVPAASGSSKTIILCHGWGANRGDIFSSSTFLLENGYNILTFDFRAHGESQGRYTTLCNKEILDFEAALQFLKNHKPRQSQKIGVLGVSMGSAVAVVGAAKFPEVLACVAENPFCSPSRVIVRYAKLFYNVPKYPLMPITLAFVRLRTGVALDKNAPLRHVARISPRPLLIIQGANDLRMPAFEGQELYVAAEKPKELWMVPGADHGEAHSVASVEYENRVLGFLQKYV